MSLGYTIYPYRFGVLVDVACCSSSRGESAGLLQSSHSSVVRAPTAKVGGLGFDSQRLPRHFFSQFVSVLIYYTSCSATAS